MMDKTEKLAFARRKLRKFQSKMAANTSPAPPACASGHGATPPPPTTAHGPDPRSSTLPREEETTSFDEAAAHWQGQGHGESAPVPLEAPPTEEVLSHQLKAAEGLNRSHKVMEALRSEYVRERATLEGQIKAHAQTVDILVAEKSSLQKEVAGLSAELEQTQEALGSSQLFLQSAKTHQAELERERDALRDQLSGAERELRQAEVRSEQQLGEERRLRSAVEEAGLERAELVSKLQTQRAQCDQLERRCAQLQAQAIQGNPHSGGEGASEEKTVAEVQKWKEEIAKLQASVHQSSVDKEELVGQVSLLQHQLERERQAHRAELEHAAAAREDQSVQLEELSALLQQAQQDKTSSLQEQEQELERDQTLRSTQEALATLERERDGLSHQLSQEVQRSRELAEEAANQELQLSQLEGQLSRLTRDAVDQQTLLHTIQEDKEALSRAMLQNKSLKEQLAELQDRFVTMSHQHMEVASELESEQIRRRRLEAALEERVQQVEALHSALAQRRPEGDGREREEAEGKGEGEEDHTDSTLASEVLLVKHSLCQVEAEKDALESQLQAVVTEQEALGHQVQQLTNERDSLMEQLRSVPPPAPVESHVTLEQYQELACNFNTLQDRFVKVMSRNAELAEQAQEAELVVLALEGENATIGEYIALYHERRSALHHRFKEKDDFIDRLLGEREQLKERLLQLQSAAEELVHTPRSPAPSESPTHLPAVEAAHPVEDEPEVSHERLLAVLGKMGRMGPHETHPVMVPCACCSGEVIHT